MTINRKDSLLFLYFYFMNSSFQYLINRMIKSMLTSNNDISILCKENYL